MDKQELDRLRYLLSREPGTMSLEAEQELRDLMRLALAELRTLRLLLVDLKAEMSRATLHALENM
jgi:hypothetical protein